jgi:mannose-1-phosphate guanylyltransferase
VAADAGIRNSVIGVDSRIGDGCVIADSVVGDNVRIGARVELLDGARVWPGVELAEGSIRFSSDA